MPTPHNRATKADIAKTVLMPGDPLRAKFCADNYLTDARLVTDVRNVLGFTGKYKGKDVTVMSSGMGSPSIGIYSYELFHEYDVDAIIRIGTSGGYQKNIEVGDLVFAMTASTDGAWAHQYKLDGTFSPAADFGLLEKAVKVAREKSIPFHAGAVLTSDLFSSYSALGADGWKVWARMGVLAQDMETYALYSNAAYLGKKALSILTMTDSLINAKSLRDEDRMEANRKMIEVALELA